MLLLGGCEKTAAGKQIDGAVFLKEYIENEEMDLDVYYVSDRDFGKQVRKVEIPDGPEGVDVVIYQTTDEKLQRYDLTTLELGINSDHVNDDGQLEKEISFDSLKITWNDGSETTEDIGNVKIVKGCEEDSGLEYRSEENGIEKYMAEKDLKITGVEWPGGGHPDSFDLDVSVNGKKADDISENDPVSVPKGKKATIKTKIRPGSSDYYVIDIMGKMKYHTDSAKQSESPFYIRYQADENDISI